MFSEGIERVHCERMGYGYIDKGCTLENLDFHRYLGGKMF